MGNNQGRTRPEEPISGQKPSSLIALCSCKQHIDASDPSMPQDVDGGSSPDNTHGCPKKNGPGCEDRVEDLMELIAKKRADLKTIKRFIDRHGAANVIHQRSKGDIFYIMGEYGRSPLEEASLQGRFDVVRMLIEQYNADIQGPPECSSSSESALQCAACGGNREIVDYLIERGAPMKKFGGELQLSALHEAAMCNQVEQTREFITKHKCDPNMRNPFGFTPLHAAAYGCALGTIKELLQLGASSAVRASDGSTLLHCAARSFMDANEVSLELIRAGVEIDARTNCGETALHVAANKKQGMEQPHMVKRLLEHGANPNVVSDAGVTPLHKAAESGADDTIVLLALNGADVHIATEVRAFRVRIQS
eukprot:gb/GECG01012520.1/.p1 GENE.gb/GECG01012520.1/~~gb/GECG01012520.1/.p1  ORF type:complete len:365 (+),score=50.01 gb/GECG01012520.1/:1-1095(+)